MEFRVKKNGVMLGPFTELQLKDMIKAGAINSDDTAYLGYIKTGIPIAAIDFEGIPTEPTQPEEEPHLPAPAPEKAAPIATAPPLKEAREDKEGQSSTNSAISLLVGAGVVVAMAFFAILAMSKQAPGFRHSAQQAIVKEIIIPAKQQTNEIHKEQNPPTPKTATTPSQPEPDTIK